MVESRAFRRWAGTLATIFATNVIAIPAFGEMVIADEMPPVTQPFAANTQQEEGSEAQTELTAEQKHAIAQASQRYAQADNLTGEDAIWPYFQILQWLRHSGLSENDPKIYERLGTNMQSFRLEMKVALVESVSTLYFMALQPENYGVKAGEYLDKVLEIYKAAGYDLSKEKPYEMLGTTKEDFEDLVSRNAIMAARQAFANIAAIDDPDAHANKIASHLMVARAYLLKAGHDLTQDQPYTAIGTTRAAFENLWCEYNSELDLVPAKLPTATAPTGP